MKHATSLALHAYWESCQSVGGPRAAGIAAGELAPLLPWLFLLDLDLLDGLRFRFCGAAIASRYGRDMTNESFLELWDGDDRRTLERDVRIIASRTAGLVAGVMAETVGGGFTSFEMLLLPLAGEHGTAGAIGSMVRTGGHAETNRIRARLLSQSLRSVRFLPVSGETYPRAAAIAAAALTATPPAIRRQYGHLTVLQGGK